MSIVYVDTTRFGPARKFLVAFYANFRIFEHDYQLVILVLLEYPARASGRIQGKYRVPVL